MRKTLIFIFLTIFIFGCKVVLSAQNYTDTTFCIVDVLNATEGVKIVQPDGLTERLKKSAIVPADMSTNTKSENAQVNSRNRGGAYRIEVFSDNSRGAKNQANARRRIVQSRFPEYPAVLVFESPFWRVKVGNFSSRSDAEAVMAEIKNALPAYAPYMRVVRN